MITSPPATLAVLSCASIPLVETRTGYVPGAVVHLQVGGVIAGALYIAIEEMQFPGEGTKGSGGLFVG